MKKIIKITARTILVVVALLGVVFIFAWKSPKYYVASLHAEQPILLFKDYTTDHAKPYVIQKENLVIFGGEHTKDPKHPQLQQLEQSWTRLKPTIALVEGRLGFLLPPFMDPVKHLGEGGKVKELAAKDGIPIYNWDLSKEALANELQQTFTREQIALAQILNPYFGNLRFGKPSSPEAFIEPYLKRAAYVGLESRFQSVDDIDKAWKRYFPELDWRDVSDETRLPGYLGNLMEAGNNLRNQHLVNAVKELTAKGERVFVICGSSHAVCVEPAFR
jgi:hypothetical protein